MVCPKCNGSFEQRLQCPSCDVRLLYQANRPGPAGGAAGPPGQWQHTPWGRILVGLLLAQGLYHGLRQMCDAGLLAVADEPRADVWKTLFGLMLQQGLQAAALLAGGMLAGAGQRRGLILGTMVGIWNALVFLLLEHFRGRRFTAALGGVHTLPQTVVTAYGEPLLLTTFGAIGGLLGSLIWRPLPGLPAVEPAGGHKGAVRFARREKSFLFHGPVAWVRVLAGVTAVVIGSLWAQGILKFVLNASEGKLAVRSHLQAQLVTLEICALATLLGSTFAGATTANGLKQGLCVGLGASAILAGLYLRDPGFMVYELVYKILSTCGLALAGGWFGGQLFPPVVSVPRRHGLRGAAGL
jgi:hypothetical protein